MALRRKYDKQKNEEKTILWWPSRKRKLKKEECWWKLPFDGIKTQKVDNVDQKEENLRFGRS